MASPKFRIAVICSAVLASMVLVAGGEQRRQERNGSAGLRERAARFSDALEEAAHGGRVRDLVPWLEVVERDSPKALTALGALVATPRGRSGLLLARVRLAEGGERGSAEYAISSPGAAESMGTVLVDWVRRNGTWYLDLVGS